MLPDINLDQQSYQELLEDAIKQIARVYPAWTNYNQSDPGITLLELFSWLQEMQQYHLDQIGDRNRLKFLKLLGVKPAAMRAARALVHITGLEEDLPLGEGEQFFAGTIPFESEAQVQLARAGLALCRSQGAGEDSRWELGAVEPGGRSRFAPFGRTPREGSVFSLGFDGPLPGGKELSLYFQVFGDYPVHRNPIRPEDGFLPLAQLRWEAWTAEGWQPLELGEDGTFQLLQSGFFRFRLPDAMAQGEEGLYWLRAVLEQSWYEIAPVLEGVYLNFVPVVQKDTLADYREVPAEGELARLPLDRRRGTQCLLLQREENGYRELPPDRAWLSEDGQGQYLEIALDQGAQGVRALFWDAAALGRLLVGEADGFPGQSWEVQLPNVMEEGLELIVKEPDGLWHVWERVDDFDSSGPGDRHFRFDEGKGLLHFGDGEHGMAPQGQLRLSRAAVSEGIDGNVKQEQIRSCPGLPAGAKVTNYWVAAGGSQGETIPQCFLRARAMLRHSERAVTPADYEEKVFSAPGLMIQNCRCVPVSRLPQRDGMGDGSVALVVQPFSDGERKKLNEGYYRNLYQVLDRYRLLGTRVRVLSPEYVEVAVFAEIRIRPYYQGAEERVRRTVERFFSTADWVFGEPVQYSALYGCLDTLDCVLAVDSLVIEARGAGVSRSQGGDVLLPPNGLVYLGRAEFTWKDGE